MKHNEILITETKISMAINEISITETKISLIDNEISGTCGKISMPLDENSKGRNEISNRAVHGLGKYS